MKSCNLERASTRASSLLEDCNRKCQPVIADQRISQAGTQQWAFDQTRLSIYVGFGSYFFLVLLGTGIWQGPDPSIVYMNLVDFLKREDSISWYFSSSDGGRGVWGPSGRDQSLLTWGQGGPGAEMQRG